MSEEFKSRNRNLFSMDWWVERLKRIPCSGILLGVLSGFFFATAGFIVKLILNINPIEVVISRSVVQLIVYLPIVILNRDSLLGIPGQRWPLFLRGASGFLSFGMLYVAYHMIPLADASTIVFSSPIITCIIAWLLLKEECGLFHAAIVSITFIGVLLISKPSFLFPTDEPDTAFLRVEGTIVSVLASFFTATNFILIRRMPTTPAAVIITVFSVVAISMGIITLVIVRNCVDADAAGFMAKGVTLPTDSFTIICLVGNGICGVLGQLCLTVALKVEEAGLVSLARTMDIVMAFVFQLIWIPEDKIEWTSIIGAVVVCSGVCFSAVRQWLKKKPGKWNAVWCLLNCGLSDRSEISETLPVTRDDRIDKTNGRTTVN